MGKCNCINCAIIGPGSGHPIHCKKCGYRGNSYYHHCEFYKAQQEALAKRLESIKGQLE